MLAAAAGRATPRRVLAPTAQRRKVCARDGCGEQRSSSAVFALWYDNWSGALESAEIDAYLKRFEATSGVEPDRLATARAFLEADDGPSLIEGPIAIDHPLDVPDSPDDEYVYWPN